jgi:hypothetical protein
LTTEEEEEELLQLIVGFIVGFLSLGNTSSQLATPHLARQMANTLGSLDRTSKAISVFRVDLRVILLQYL